MRGKRPDIHGVGGRCKGLPRGSSGHPQSERKELPIETANDIRLAHACCGQADESTECRGVEQEKRREVRKGEVG